MACHFEFAKDKMNNYFEFAKDKINNYFEFAKDKIKGRFHAYQSDVQNTIRFTFILFCQRL